MSHSPADITFINGCVYTVDPRRPWAKAVAVSNGRFTAVGSASDISAYIGPETQVIDLAGKMVLPGFIDSHAHASCATNEAASLEMFHLESLADYLDAVREFAADHPEHEVIYGGGWHNDLFPPTGPVKEALDAIVSDRPVCLTSEDGHFDWVNSKAIEMAGISKDTVAPAGGIIEKDSRTGEPSGTFRETILTDATRDADQVRNIKSMCEQHDTPLFQMTGIKVFVDGVVEGATAFLLEPYAHMPDTCGEPLWDLANLKSLFAEAEREQLQIHIHAIGDAAIRMSLDALAHAGEENGKSDTRHLITHLHLVDQADIPRMAALNVIGVPQPFWFVKGDYFHNLEAKYLGLDRAEKEYPMKSLANAGILLAGASDYPVQVPSPPLMGIMLGVTRCEPGETDPNEILGPEERMALSEMIECFTINGARANFLEKETGSIEVGKKADMVVLENNLFDIPETDIADTKVMMTVFEGKTVYQDTAL